MTDTWSLRFRYASYVTWWEITIRFYCEWAAACRNGNGSNAWSNGEIPRNTEIMVSSNPDLLWSIANNPCSLVNHRHSRSGNLPSLRWRIVKAVRETGPSSRIINKMGFPCSSGTRWAWRNWTRRWTTGFRWAWEGTATAWKWWRWERTAWAWERWAWEGTTATRRWRRWEGRITRTWTWATRWR